MEQNKTIQIASKLLGKNVSGSEFYDPSLLVAVPREENRTQYNITKDLPFIGYDIWHAYEVSFLTNNGMPISRVLKIKYSCDNDYIVESKSLKLYLNSFNMTKLGNTVYECLENFVDTVQYDLENLLGTYVDLNLHDMFSNLQSKMFTDFKSVESLINIDDIVCDYFKEAPEVLVIDETRPMFVKFSFNALRSNCRVTNQPDFGDVFIHIKSNKSIKLENIVKYIVSFRKESHFHEECVEMIYKRLYDALNPEELMVGALYTRRGGIDICPIRANKEYLLDSELISENEFTRRTIKQ